MGFIYYITIQSDFLGGSAVKNLLANAGDSGSIPGSGRSPREGSNNPLQYSCLGNPMDRGTWQATAPEISEESGTTEHVQDVCPCIHTHTHTHTHKDISVAL